LDLNSEEKNHGISTQQDFDFIEYT